MEESRPKTKRQKKSSSSSENEAPSLPFEQGLAQLEQIVSHMEEVDLPLDQLIEKYERGMQLIQLCERQLNQAEKKVEMLTRPSTTPLSEPSQEKNKEIIEETEDDCRLF